MKRSPLRKKAKAKSAGWWQRACDDLMQDIHKQMFDKCMVCGRANEVGHHYITKSLSSYLRYSFLNLIPLCHSCHFNHHIRNDPNIHNTINRKNGEEWVKWIEEVRRKPIKTGITYYQTMHATFEKALSDYKKST